MARSLSTGRKGAQHGMTVYENTIVRTQSATASHRAVLAGARP
jgi:hypothetical protein